MNKGWYGVLVGVLSLSLTGCVTVKKVVRERVDQDVSGNQGFLQGKGVAPAKTGQTTREYVDIRVEIPTWGEVKKELPKPMARKSKRTTPGRDREVSGNQGFISSGRGFEQQLPPVYKPKPVASRPTEPAVYEEAETADKVTVAPRTHKVREGDSLSKIAKDVYGKSSKWTVIYEANSDKIKDPNRIKTGIVLTIPELEEAESDYLK